MSDGAGVSVEQVIAETTRLVEGVRPEQLDDQTPCADWKVRDLLNHLIGGGRMFAVAAEQGSIPDDLLNELMTVDQVGEDYKAAWRASSQQAVQAFGKPDVPEKILKLPFGDLPGSVVTEIVKFDVTTHAADLARATGQQVDEQLCESALQLGKAMIGPEMRKPGFFDAEQPAPEGAPASQRLLAFAGRCL